MSRFAVLILVVATLFLLGNSSAKTVRSTLVYAHCTNRRRNVSAVLCGNYQYGSVVAKHLEDAATYRLAFWPDDDDHWCSVPGENVSFYGKAVFGVLRPTNGSVCPNGDAEVNVRLDVLKSRGGEVALFEEGPLSRWYTNPDVNISRFEGSVFYFDSPSVQEMERLYQNNRNECDDMELRFYTSDVESFNLAYLLNVLIPTFCVVLGGIWSGRSRKSLYFPRAGRKGQLGTTDPLNGDDREDKSDHTSARQKSTGKQEEIEHLGCATIMIAIAFTVSLILLLYFFYDYLIWFFLVIYVVGSADSLYKCLTVVIGRNRLLEYGWPVCNICSASGSRCFGRCKKKLCPFKLTLRLLCFSLPITWFVVRKKWYAFILQDVLGVFISITAIRFFRLPSLKVATIFLTMFLLYDVFMVSGSPYLTKGCSIMTYVATGGFCNDSELMAGSHVWRESLPLVFLFPHVTPNSVQCLKYSSITSYPFALYGIGDVILPGSVVGFGCAYDLSCKTPYMLYFAVSSVAYALGTSFTFYIGRLLSTSQPALLYLVPAVLLPTHLIGLCRGEWKKLWNGQLHTPDNAVVAATDGTAEARLPNE
uniref:Signal peptide peptidase-like 2B n=1 Tax=Trichuris muris TaxID=70415 RepID=A0A5S6QDR1_TRIMR